MTAFLDPHARLDGKESGDDIWPGKMPDAALGRAVQSAVDACILESPLPLELEVDALGLAGEAGEVADVVKKLHWAGQGLGTYDGDQVRLHEALVEELGDVMFHWLRLVYITGSTPSVVLRGLAKKVERRNRTGKR